MSASGKVRTAARLVSRVVNKSADAPADLVETAGHLIGDGLTLLGRRTPYAGGILRWLGAVVVSLCDLFAALAKGAGAVVGGLLAGLIRVVGGACTLDRPGIRGGLVDVAAGIAGALIAVVGKAVALVQVLLGIGWPRPLSTAELAIIRRVFDGAIATYNVRVVDGSAGLFSRNNRPFVLGNMIYLKGFSAATNPEVLAHECTHIWQNQHIGAGYAAEALASQFWGIGYDWSKQANANVAWVDFGREAQGQSVEDLYTVGGSRSGASGNGTFFAEADPARRSFSFGAVDRSALGNDAIRTLRGVKPWRLTALFD
jgi:hypothetical protein